MLARVPITVASRRRSAANLAAAFPGATILDVTSRGAEPWVRFSPFFPHGGIPVPFMPGRTAQSVEGIWQGLKVFESDDVDESKFDVTTMKGIKRTVRSNGRVRGHRAGAEILAYRVARERIYVPTYRWVLENCVAPLVDDLRARSAAGDVVLLDYELNGDIDDLSKPLSHAALVKRWAENAWPR
jgi:hypothetical protein